MFFGWLLFGLEALKPPVKVPDVGTTDGPNRLVVPPPVVLDPKMLEAFLEASVGLS